MDIQIDTREKQRAIRKIIKTFDDNGVKHFSSKLLVGDYMSLDNPRLIIDRKQNLQELCGNVCQQHERFKRELLKAIDAEIQLVILVEHGPDIQSLEDVWFWENPRKHEVRWRMVNGKREKYVVSAKAVDGNQLYKSLCTMEPLASLTAVLDGPNDLAQEGANANEILIPKMSMSGLADYDKQTGYALGDVTLDYETKKCDYDRGRMFTVDAMDNIESAGIAFGRLSGEFLRTQVVPELDTWRLAKYDLEAIKEALNIN